MKFRHFALVLITLFSFLQLGCGKSDQSSSSGGGAITLALNTKPGDKQTLTSSIDQHITTQVMDQDLKIDQVIEMDMTMTTKELKDTIIVLEGTFDRWAMKMDMQGAGMSNQAEFDTKDSTKNKGDMAPMMSQMFTKMLGQPFEIQMAKNGEVLSTNMKDVMAKVMPPGSTNSMSDDAMTTIAFPTHPIKPGDSWVSDIDRDLSGKPAILRANYTLKEVKDGVAYLTFTGEVLMKADNKKLGTMNGTYSIFTATGMLRDGESKMQLDMEVDSPAGTKQQVKLDQTTKMTGKS